MRLNHRSAPLRFIVGLLAGWTGLRAMLVLVSADTVAPLERASRSAPLPGVASVSRRIVPVPRSAAAPPQVAAAAVSPRRIAAAGRVQAVAHRRAPDAPPVRMADQRAQADGAMPASFTLLLPDRPVPLPVVPEYPAAAATTRWSGWAYAFLRQGSGTRSLAPGQAQLGGSQAAARIAYRLAPRLSAAVRLSSAIEDRASEGAVGIEWQPLPAIRFVAERRIVLDGGGRSAWSAYAAGGFTRQRGPITIDGYAQGGVVGLRAGDLFVDGAVRVGRGIGPVVVGGGMWAAAQPGAARIDVGPRIAARLGDTPLTLAVEHRVRVAGDARPGSGFALTLGADF